MTNANNDCVICLESLATDTVGACVPCGHCFHEQCFQHYKASGRGRSMEDHHGGVGIKCPMCNGISNVFVRIFIDLNAMNETTINSNNDENDDDNASLSSVESSSFNNRNGTKIKEAPKDNSNHGSNFVDLVNDNDENSTTNNNNEHDHRRRVQKYKRKGKALKKSIEEFKSKQLQCNEDIMQLEAKYRLAHAELRAFQAEQDDLVYEDIEVRRELEGTRLACITATRELAETKASITRLQQELATAQSNLDEYTKNHKLHVAKAYAQSMNQADEILAKHPKAMQQRSTLRKENEELRAQLDILQKAVHGAAAASSSKSRSSTAPPQKTMKRMHSSNAPTVSSTASQPAPHRASTAAAASNRRENARVVISQEEGERDENQRQATQQQQDKQHHKLDETSSKVKRKVSEQAARMDFMSRKAPKRGALELLQRTKTTTTNNATTTHSTMSSSSSEAAARRTATVNTTGVYKRSTTTSTAHGAQPNQQQHANAGNDNKRPRPSNWRINEFGLAVPTTPPTPTMGRFHATSSSSNH